MKRFTRLVLLMVVFAALAGLFSCSSDDDGGGKSSGTNAETKTLQPYLPSDFSAKKAEAYYVKSESGDYPSEGVRNYSGTYAFYFFGDNSWIMTVSAEWTQNGQKMSPKSTVYEGTFIKEGTYTNGKLRCTTTKSQNPFGCMPMPPAPSELNVADGKFTVQSYTFQKR